MGRSNRYEEALHTIRRRILSAVRDSCMFLTLSKKSLKPYAPFLNRLFFMESAFMARSGILILLRARPAQGHKA
jgi:hypothetical protein